MKRTRIVVSVGANGWAVTRAGLGLDSTHVTKEAATRRAAAMARAKQPSELVIKRADGTIQETRRYGSAGFPVRPKVK